MKSNEVAQTHAKLGCGGMNGERLSVLSRAIGGSLMEKTAARAALENVLRFPLSHKRDCCWI
jgi:hypothetical protein